MSYFTRVQKFNPNHGPDGRFAHSPGGGAGRMNPESLAAAQPKPATDPKGMYNEFKDRKALVAAYREGSGRLLNFMVDKEMSVEAFRQAMGTATPGGYNNFNANRVANFLSKWNDQIKVSPGRAMSPLLMVHGSPKVLAEIAKLAKRGARADEIDIHQSYRVWTEADVNNPNRRGPMTMDQRTGREFKNPVLRLWWD